MTRKFNASNGFEVVKKLGDDDSSIRVESIKTGASFTFHFKRCDSMTPEEQDAWFVRVEDSDDSSYLALMKKVNVDDVNDILREKQRYLKSKGYYQLSENCSLEDANLFQINENLGGGFAQCRLTRKSFENGFNYRHPAFKALFYVMRNAFSNGNVKNTKIFIEQDDLDSYPLPECEDDLF